MPQDAQMSDYKLYRCLVCSFEYDEALGWPEDGIAPGTRWEDIPEDWSCPDCGAAKSDFEMIEVARPGSGPRTLRNRLSLRLWSGCRTPRRRASCCVTRCSMRCANCC